MTDQPTLQPINCQTDSVNQGFDKMLDNFLVCEQAGYPEHNTIHMTSTEGVEIFIQIGRNLFPAVELHTR